MFPSGSHTKKPSVTYIVTDGFLHGDRWFLFLQGNETNM